MSVFDGLRARLDRLLAETRSPEDRRAYAAGLRDAVIEAKAAVSAMRDQLAATERELGLERRQLADAERRGQLAAEIADQETVAIAERFAARHRERADVRERKLAVQHDELDLGVREAPGRAAGPGTGHRRSCRRGVAQHRRGRWHPTGARPRGRAAQGPGGAAPARSGRRRAAGAPEEETGPRVTSTAVRSASRTTPS